MTRLDLLVNTVRHLKIKQLYYQVYYRVCNLSVRECALPPVRERVRRVSFLSYSDPATENGENFKFFGEAAELTSGWNNPSLSKIWLYNLHYQDDLNSKEAEKRTDLCVSLVDAWIEGNLPVEGNGWEPYCLSLRIVNWVKFFWRLEDQAVKLEWLESLTQQVHALEQQIEFHILANHLFSNAKALVFAGAFLGGSAGDRWLNKGLKLLDVEVQEQFLDDGAHYELSPMYQSLLLWDLADLIALQRASDLKELDSRVSFWTERFIKGVDWLRAMTHPDGDIAFFNDATLGIAPALDDLKVYACHLGVALPSADEGKGVRGRLMEASGFAVVNWPEGHRLMVDAALVGPDYQPGHAHADTLSCELSLFSQRVLVNSGISQYGEDAERHRQRSTAAHNTVEVDGKNSSEVWAGFRVARRARPFDVALHQDVDGVRLAARHDGYRRLRGKVTHSRQWHAQADQLMIEDSLDGNYQSAVAHWHFHPEVRILQREDDYFSLTLPKGEEVDLYVEGGMAVLKDSTWHPGFGLSIPNKKLEITILDSRLLTRIEWRTA